MLALFFATGVFVLVFFAAVFLAFGFSRSGLMFGQNQITGHKALLRLLVRCFADLLLEVVRRSRSGQVDDADRLWLQRSGENLGFST